MYEEIKKILSRARNKDYQTSNFAIVEAWNNGKNIVEQQGGEEKAEYAIGLIKELLEHMTRDFGKWLTTANLLKYAPILYCISKWLRTA